MKMSKLFKGLASVTSFIFALALGLSLFSQDWTGTINAALEIDNVEIQDPEAGSASTQYFKSEFGNGSFSAANQALLLDASKEQSYNEVAEGSILFKNNGALPLKSNERKISIFGNNVKNFVYMASNGGEGNSVFEDNSATFLGSLAEAGFEVNPTLLDAYKNSGVGRSYPNKFVEGQNNIGEAPLSVYTNEVKASFDDYNDAAIILITREYGEGNDAMMVDGQGLSELAMHQEEKDMINLVKTCGKFDKIIVLLNTTYTVELGWCEDDKIDAVLCIGFPGQWGAKAIPDLLTGVVNPSGRTPDTWATNSLSAPACVNEGTETPTYTNVSDIRKTVTGDNDDYVAYMSTLVESIYVGYKYYETRYEDVVLNRFGASDKVGSTQDQTKWDYAKEMVYPFGSGLSYTTFSEKITSVDETTTPGHMLVSVEVKNTGSVAGKHSVQVFANTPYGDYEKEHLVEKAAVNIVGYAKTKLLEPNETETIVVDVDKYLLASYDSDGAKGYILSAGDYYLGIGNNAHDALNNILAKKGCTGMVDELGNAVAGDVNKVYTWKLDELDTESYKNSLITGKRVTNRFETCDLNHFYDEKKVTYISRQDWKGTYPVEQTRVAATDEMIYLLKGYFYEKPANAPSLSEFVINDKSLNIPLIKLRGKSFDDPLWDEYFKQWSIDELARAIAEGCGTKAIPQLGVPKAGMYDGPLGLVLNLPNNREACTTWPCEPILAATCNKDIMYRRGQLMGEHCLWTKTQSMNSPGCNLHRTPFNGRNPIYYSEDGNMTYLVSVHEVLGYRSKGASGGGKHFCLNDQEFARQGVSNFFQEQALRETSLRGFENVLTTDHSYGCMMAFNRIGCVSQNNDYLTKAVTREEWGFVGFLQSDATVKYSKDRLTILDSGLDLFTADGSGQSTRLIKEQINNFDDGYLYQKLVQAVKRSQMNIVNSNCMNGISENAKMIVHTPWWVTGEIAICCGSGVLALGTITLAVLFDFKIIGGKKKDEAE